MGKKRANGEGTIYQIETGPKKGTWVAQITTKSGKRKTFYGKKRHEVKEKMDTYREQEKLGIDLEGVKGKLFGDWVLDWMELYKKNNVRISTYEDYKYLIKSHILPVIGEVALGKLTTNEIQQVYNNMSSKKLSPGTIKRTHWLISSCLDKAVEIKLLVWNPAKATQRPKLTKPEFRFFTEDEMSKFLNYLETQETKWQAAFLVVLGTGLRLGEVLALEWRDIDFDNSLMTIRQTLSYTKATGLILNEPKTASSKASIPIPSIVKDALKKHKKEQAAIKLKYGDKYNKEVDLVFATKTGTFIWQSVFQVKYNRIRNEAGVTNVHLHGLRHTFATRMLEQGENLKVVQELLRHSDIKTTANVYSHVTPETKQKAAHKMDSLLKRSIK